MNRRVRLLIMAVILSFCLIAIPSQRIYGASAFEFSSSNTPIVVCTTTVLASIVEDLAKDMVTVEVIASPAVCPAHYDVKPSDVEAFKHANLILMHGIEPWVNELKEASGSTAPIVKISGPWNTPDMLKAKYASVAEALQEYLGIDVSSRLEKCLKSIDEIKEWLLEFAEENGFKNTPVVCMLWQKAFISFLGFDIVAVYGPPEKVSAKQYESIVENATKHKALLVIDNIQSGIELGEKIASEIGAVEVALSNFPKIAPGLSNMTAVMKWNAVKLAEALQSSRYMIDLIKLNNQVATWKTATIASSVISIAELLIIVALILSLKKK